MGRKILFVTTDQQRYDTLGCNGGTLARTPVVDAPRRRGRPLRAGRPAVGRVHAVALHDAHRPAPEHPRRVDERRAAARSTRRRWPRCCTAPATAPRSSASRTSSRSSTRSAASPRTRSPGRAATADRRGRRHRRPAPRLRPPRVRHPRRRWARCTTPAGCWPNHPEALGDVLPGARRRPRGERRRRRRHRRAAGEGQPDPARVVPHRLGGRPHDRLARLARRRRRLVLLDELPRPAPPVGPAGVGARPRRLARRAAAGRLPRRPRPSASASSTPSRGTGGSGTTARSCRTTRRPTHVGAGHADRRPGARGQRPQRGRVRADRRGARPGARRRSPRAGGPTTSTSSSPPTTASCRATSACCSRGRTTSTG